MIEREVDELPGERLVDDQLSATINSLIALIFETFPVEGAERKAMMIAVLDLHRQLRERSRVRLLN